MIETDTSQINRLRELFVRRMTVDSETNDRRRKEFNQAIFHFESDDEVDNYNRYCEQYGPPKKKYGATYPVWSEITLDMVLTCFDDAVRDYNAERQEKPQKANQKRSCRKSQKDCQRKGD